MQKKSFLRLFLEAAGYAAIGNLLGLGITVSLGAFFEKDFMVVIAAFCSISIYLIMITGAGHKDGEHERKLIGVKRLEKPEPDKWIIIGVIIWLLLCVPCAALIIFPGFLLVFRFTFGAVFALSLLFGNGEIPVFAPFVFMGVYALTPLMFRVGYYIGFNEKLTVDSIVYKKKK